MCVDDLSCGAFAMSYDLKDLASAWHLSVSGSGGRRMAGGLHPSKVQRRRSVTLGGRLSCADAASPDSQEKARLAPKVPLSLLH